MNFSNLNYLDYLIIAILMLSTLFAFIRGFIGSFLSLTGWILSIYFAYTFFPYVKPLLEEKINNPLVIIVVGHACLLIGFLIAFGIINLLATTAVKGLTSGLLDRILGACFGIIRGMIVVSFIFLLATTGVNIFNGVDQDRIIKDDVFPKWLTSSKTYPYMQEGSQILAGFIPQSFYDRFQSISDDLTKKTKDDRFVDGAIEKLKKSMSSSDLDSIDDILSDNYNIKPLTNEELKYSKLEKLLDAYDHNSHKKDLKKTFTKDDLNKLRKILKDKDVELQNINPKPSNGSKVKVEPGIKSVELDNY